MKSIVLITAIVFICIIFFIFLNKRIKIYPNENNIGVIKIHEKVAFSYHVRNLSFNKIKVIDINTICNCTVADQVEYNIYPFKDNKITIEFTPNELGIFKRPIEIIYDVSEFPYVVYFTGKVVK